LNQTRPLPYVIGDTAGLKREVTFSEEWISLIKDNTVSILGWIQFEKASESCISTNKSQWKTIFWFLFLLTS
jgi:hypothetical protein